jgi:hypothetical protein
MYGNRNDSCSATTSKPTEVPVGLPNLTICVTSHGWHPVSQQNHRDRLVPDRSREEIVPPEPDVFSLCSRCSADAYHDSPVIDRSCGLQWKDPHPLDPAELIHLSRRKKMPRWVNRLLLVPP